MKKIKKLKSMKIFYLLIPALIFTINTFSQSTKTDEICESIQVSKDKFSDEATYRSPQTDGITLIKMKSKDYIDNYINIVVNGLTLNVDKTGLFILFDDGTKIEKPNAQIDVDTEIGVSGYIYSIFEPLNDEEIKLLSKQKITDVKIHFYDKVIENGDKISEYMKCINKK